MTLAFLFVFAMNTTVAMIDGGPAAIAHPFSWGGSEYFDDVRYVKTVQTFLHGYVDNMYHYSLHSRTHPPGAVLFLYLVKCLFGKGISAAAWAAVTITASAVIPFYLLARELADDHIAAIGTAIYAVVPSLVLFGATSMDGVFLVPLMGSIYFMRRVISKPGIGNTIAAGLSLFVSLLMSYVTSCVGVLMLLYALLEIRRDRSILPRLLPAFAIIGAIVILGLWSIDLWSGFNYLNCFKSSRYFDHYLMRTFTISFGRYWDISFSNLAAFLIGMGLPVVVLWWKQMRNGWQVSTPLGRFLIAGTITVIGFSFARLFTRETERIWLFFSPVAILAAAASIAKSGVKEQRLSEWTLGLLFAQTWLFQVLLYTIW